MSNLEELNYAIISDLRDQIEAKEQMIKNLTKKLDIAIKFMKFVERYDCKIVTPRDFNKYEAVWFLIRSEAQEKLEQIEEINAKR